MLPARQSPIVVVFKEEVTNEMIHFLRDSLRLAISGTKIRDGVTTRCGEQQRRQVVIAFQRVNHSLTSITILSTDGGSFSAQELNFAHSVINQMLTEAFPFLMG